MSIHSIQLEDIEDRIAPPYKLLDLSVVDGEVFLYIVRYEETFDHHTSEVITDSKGYEKFDPKYYAGRAAIVVSFRDLLNALHTANDSWNALAKRRAKEDAKKEAIRQENREKLEIDPLQTQAQADIAIEQIDKERKRIDRLELAVVPGLAEFKDILDEFRGLLEESTQMEEAPKKPTPKRRTSGRQAGQPKQRRKA